MQLTRLDIKGFKSFGDKITIHFDEGVTAIAGPNGCGKSNVVDAIRWVLGEQSTRALRSEKMENIIFNGTQNRKPAQLAEVSLSFTNNKNVLPTDFSQVTITRKLYRNGDSEYRLNDVQCRLKDITDLFLDTGIGSDSYAIIELKMVEEIISNKEHSRRNLFEEASGISKYKVRKKQAFNRLKDTQSDLNRVDDILLEIEKNLKTLETQAKKADRYYLLKEQYKTSSLQLAALKIADALTRLEQLEQKKKGEEAESSALQLAIQNSEEALEFCKKEIAVQEQHLAFQQRKVNEVVDKIRNFETEKRIKSEQISTINQRTAQLESEIQQEQAQKQVLNSQLKRLKEEILASQQALFHLEAVLTKLEEQNEGLKKEQAEEKRHLDEIIQEKEKEEQQVQVLEKQIAVQRIQRDALLEEANRNQTQEATREQELSIFILNAKELEVKIKDLTHLLQSTEEKEKENQNAQTALREEIESLIEETTKTNRLLDAKQNEYNLTKSMVDNLEGFPESIKFLRKSTGWDKKIPLFSDVLLCQAPYRAAIENYLEPYLNYYVVDRFEEATKAVHLLGHAGKGKAGFFILENLVPLKTLQPMASTYLPALEVIETEEKYLPLCQQLLHNVYFQTENKLDNPVSPGLVLLDPDGRYIQQDFSLKGGAVGLFEGKRIGRSKNLELLGKEIHGLKEKQEKLKNITKERNENLKILQQEHPKSLLITLNKQLNQLRNEQIAVQVKKEQYEALLQSNLGRQEQLTRKANLLTEELQALVPSLEKHKSKVESLAQKATKHKEDYEHISMELNDSLRTFSSEQILFHQQKNQHTSLEKDIEHREILIERMDRKFSENNVELESLKNNLLSLLDQGGLSEEELRGLYEEKESVASGLKEIEKEYKQLRSDAENTENDLKTIRQKLAEKQALLSELKDQITQEQLQLHSTKERLSIEFSLSLSDLPDPQLIHQSQEELSGTVGSLKKRLDDFGGINPMAMQAYEEMKERHLFIVKEKTDLMEAKNTLMKTIEEIDHTAQEKFMEAFLKVRENFKGVFRSLFNEEDTCDLVILDPANPLDSDIDIIAKPKGKKPLSIHQLSGGEKTLTATAILFSLYLLKPAPFCVFDEIDAPLDDTNIDKFNRIIRKFSDRSQFIIISHNKRTIASTDVIYGVTMVEPGVSRVVAVDMRDSFESIVNVQ